MVLFLGILQFLLITCILLFEFKNKSSAVFLWATLFIMFGVMHLFASFIGDEQYFDDVLIQASVFAILFCLIYILFRVLLGYRSIVRSRKRMQYKLLEAEFVQEKCGTFFLIVFLAVMLLKTYPYVANVGNILMTSWSSGRDYGASVTYANSSQLFSILMYALSGVAVVFWMEKKRWYCLFSLLALGLGVLLTRNRIEVLPILCAIIIVFILKTQKIRMRTLVFGGIAAVSVIYIVYGLRVFRHYGTIDAFLREFQFSDFMQRIHKFIITDNGELGLRRDFYYFIDNDNNFKSFGEGHTYLRMLLVYVPTQWSFGLKPDDFAMTMGAAKGMIAGGSTHPTLFGDCYANLGMLGVFLGAFWAIYANVVDWITTRQKNPIAVVLIYALCAVTYVIMGRGSVYNGFFFVAYGIPFIVILFYLKRHVKLKV